jgi:hypothetical protein
VFQVAQIRDLFNHVVANVERVKKLKFFEAFDRFQAILLEEPEVDMHLVLLT